MTHGCGCGIVIRCDEFDVLIFKPEIIDRFLNEVVVLVADVAEFDGGNSNEEDAAVGVTVAGGLQPRVIGMPVDFLLERVEDANPRIRGKSCSWNRHKRSSRGRRLVRARLCYDNMRRNSVCRTPPNLSGASTWTKENFRK